MIQKLYIWIRRYRLHLLVWAIYIAYEISVAALAYDSYGRPLNYTFHYSIIITLFYIHARLGMPLALKNKRSAFWTIPLLIAVEGAAFLMITFGADLLLIKLHSLEGPLEFNSVYAIKDLYRELFFMGFSSGYYFLLTYNSERRRNENLERQRFNEIIFRQWAEQELGVAQNAFLKAQINPHFLFNTLDFIYHKVVSHSPEAAEAVITLSEMMRFAIDADKMGEFILLNDELEQVLNLLTLNNLRKNEAISFHLTYEQEAGQLHFIPLVLLTLTENIFKHGDMSNNKQASLNVCIEEDMLVIRSCNVTGRAVTASHHTGLVNLEKRLRFAYGESVVFNYGDDDGLFRVLVQVPLALLSSASANIDKGQPHAAAVRYQKHG